jgi:hypothetical protein
MRAGGSIAKSADWAGADHVFRDPTISDAKASTDTAASPSRSICGHCFVISLSDMCRGLDRWFDPGKAGEGAIDQCSM